MPRVGIFGKQKVYEDMTSVRCDSRHRQTGTGRSPEMVAEETGATGINMRFLISGDASQKSSRLQESDRNNQDPSLQPLSRRRRILQFF
jgi:hypothetical protein